MVRTVALLVPTCLRPVAQRACAPRWQRLVETTGAVQVRRAEERCKEAERATKLWETRRWQTRYVAGTLRNSRGAAGPGASLPRCPVLQPRASAERTTQPPAAEGRKRRAARQCLRRQQRQDTWCVEELATDEAGCQVGIYAYDTARWASAALRLDERCTFFGQEVLEEVERQQEAAARAVADFWGGCGLAEGSLDERLRW